MKDARTKANEIIEQAHQRANQIDRPGQERRDRRSQPAEGAGRRPTSTQPPTVRAKTCASRCRVLAVTGAEKLLRREIDASAHKALLDELAAQL